MIQNSHSEAAGIAKDVVQQRPLNFRNLQVRRYAAVCIAKDAAQQRQTKTSNDENRRLRDAGIVRNLVR